MSTLAEALRQHAMRLPDTEEGVACEGTAVEKRTIKAKKKAFLFLGAADLLLKLGDARTEAEALEAKGPGRVKVGAHGWVTVKLGEGPTPPLDVLQRWVEESHRLATGGAGAKPTAAKAAVARPKRAKAAPAEPAVRTPANQGRSPASRAR